MPQDNQDTVQSFLSDISDLDTSIEGGIDAARRAFQEAYEANNAEVPTEQFLSDLEKLEQVSELLSKALTLPDQYRVLTQTYLPVVNELKQRYSDFISDEVSQNLTDSITKPIASYQLIEAQSMIADAMKDLRELKDRAAMLYTGLVRISETLENYIKYFSVRLREDLRIIASMFLSDPAFHPESYASDQTAYSYMLGVKNTARSILWQIDNYPEEAKYTVKELVDWAKTNPGWAGDDFEECLDYVNRARRG